MFSLFFLLASLNMASSQRPPSARPMSRGGIGSIPNRPPTGMRAPPTASRLSTAVSTPYDSPYENTLGYSGINSVVKS